jgi:hypothetical protein
VTSASDSDWYIRCASALSGSLVETTSPAADACWLTVHAATAPQAREPTIMATMSSLSAAGAVVGVSRLASPRRRGAAVAALSGGTPGGR